jgi:hypothetical protein
VITDLLLKMNQRYPTASERQRINDYLSGVSARMTALEEMRVTQKSIIAEVLTEYAKLYPRFKQYHPQGWDKIHRDMEMCVAFCGNAMLLAETDSMDNAWLIWFRTIMKSVHLTPQFMSDSFRLWDEVSRKQLSPATYELMKPYMDHIAQALCDIPEPARPEVGERREPVASRKGVAVR